jgi:predicted PurR-regulated permease PerM
VLFKNINDPNRSLLRKIYIVRFFIRLYKTYTTKGFISVLYESFNYIINLIFLKIDSKSSTLFNDVPKIMAIWGIYISYCYIGGKNSILIFGLFLGIDFAYKFIIWVIIKIFNKTNMLIECGDDRTPDKLNKTLSSIISYSLIIGMMVLLIAGFAILTFLFLLDLNELRKNTIDQSSLVDFLSDNNAIIGRLDSSMKPYLKKFLRGIHLHSSLPYEFNVWKFNDMTSLQSINDFAKQLNITNASDIFTLYQKYGWDEHIMGENGELISVNCSLTDLLFPNAYQYLRHFMGSHGDKLPELNTQRLYSISKSVLEYLLYFIIELTNFSFYFIVFLSWLTYLVTMDQDIIQLSVRYLPVEGRETKQHILRSLAKSVRGVFLSPIKISVTLSTVAWVILDVFGVKYQYIYWFLTTLITFLPVFSPSILGIPAALYLYFGAGFDGIYSIAFLGVYYLTTSKIFTDIYSNELASINPILLFLSLVNGLYVFDIKGFLYGPMIIWLIHATMDFMKFPQNVKNKRSKSLGV